MSAAGEAGAALRPVTELVPVMRPWLGPEEAEAAAAAVASGWIAQGPRVRDFEDAFAERVGAPHAVAVSSCTSALHLALVASGIEPGDEVIVPSLSFIATANVCRYVGAQPVFADVDLETQNLTPETIAAVVTPRTKAVILVHQGGMPADIDAVQALCDARGLALVEDAACAIGSTYRGRPIGSHSELVAFSFHPRKIVTTGEGGMLVVRSEAAATRVRQLREHGMSVSAADRHASRSSVLEQYLETGFNYRMTDIQAAVGVVQLGRLDAMIERRRALAERYARELGAIAELCVPRDPAYGTTNHQSYAVRLPEGAPDQTTVLGALLDAGISARRGIMAAHLEPAYAAHPHGPLPHTEWLTRRTIILPLYHQLTETQQDRVVAALAAAITRGGAP